MAKERLLRDWTDSETMNELSAEAEVFFTRLIMKADDYGSFYANPKLLKANLFPLRDTLKDATVTKWINELTRAGLLFTYVHEGKSYIRIINFGQRLRNMRNTFPQPDTNSPQVAANSRNRPPELEEEVEEEREEEKEDEVETNVASDLHVWPMFDDFWDAYDKKVDRAKCEKKWEKIKQAAREKIMEHLELYVRSTPDVKYRKDPATYLNNESWNNDIITVTPTKNGATAKGTLDRLNSYTDKR